MRNCKGFEPPEVNHIKNIESSRFTRIIEIQELSMLEPDDSVLFDDLYDKYMSKFNDKSKLNGN